MILLKRVWHNARYTKLNARLLSVCFVKDAGNFFQAFANSCAHEGKLFLDSADSFDLIYWEFSNCAENQFGSIFCYLLMNFPAGIGSESISGNDKDIKSCYRFARIFAFCISFGPFRYLRVKVRNIGIELFNQLTPPSAVTTSSTKKYTSCVASLVHVDFQSNPFRPYRT